VRGRFLLRPAAAVECAEPDGCGEVGDGHSRGGLEVGDGCPGSETLPLLGTLKQTFCVGQERVMDSSLARGHLRVGVNYVAGFVDVLAL
jgi:hypothetical protein